MTQRIIARATIRDCRILDVCRQGIQVKETPMWVRHSMWSWNHRRGDAWRLVGLYIDIRVRHFVLNEGTDDETHVWDAIALGRAS